LVGAPPLLIAFGLLWEQSSQPTGHPKDWFSLQAEAYNWITRWLLNCTFITV